MPERFAATLRRYCDDRIRYSNLETRALRIGGVSALPFGIPLAAVGLVVSWFANSRSQYGEPEVVADHLGWALERLRDAEVVFEPLSTPTLAPTAGTGAAPLGPAPPGAP